MLNGMLRTIGVSLLLSTTANAAINVTINAPTPGTLTGSTLFVSASVTSTNQILSVSAQVGTVMGPLAYAPSERRWTGSLALSGLFFGEQQLTVTASDALGGSAFLTIPIIFDKLPAVSVSLPAEGDVARPSVHLMASCADDGPAGCASLKAFVRIGDSIVNELASGTSSIDAVVSLASFDGQAVTLSFEGRDSANQQAVSRQSLYVDSSASLLDVVRLSNVRRVLDVSADRVVYLAGTPPALTFRLKTLSTGDDVAIGTADGLFFPDLISADLTDAGAIYRTDGGEGDPGNPPVDARGVYDWRSGTRTFLTANATDVSVKRPWAAYFLGTGADTRVTRRNLSTDAAVSTALPGLRTYPRSIDVTSAGDVVYDVSDEADTRSVYRLRDGINTRVCTNGCALPVADDVHVALLANYRPPYGHFAGSGTVGVAGTDGVLLEMTAAMEPAPIRHRDYEATGGWVAFTKSAADGTRQVWLLSPSNVQTQVSYLGKSSFLRAMGPAGRVAFESGGRVYATGPSGSSPRDVASSLGTFFFRDGAFYDAIGGSVFRVAEALDPGSTSRLTLVSGNVAGQSVSSTVRTVNVAPGQPLSGEIVVRITSTWPGGTVMSMGMTPSWGSHRTSFVDLGGFDTPQASLDRLVPLGFTAPTTAGTYRLVLAFRPEATAANLMSATNHAVGSDVWDNGDDVAGWTSVQLASADGAGTTPASYLFSTGASVIAVPATTLIVVVGGGGTGGGCTTSGGTLCLLNRFKLSVAWKNPYDGGSTGVGTAIPYSVNTGMFWFFEAPNLELMVKMLDGTGVNGRLWLFYGALSDVEYAITVTDTVTGVVRTYRNLPRTLTSVADINAF